MINEVADTEENSIVCYCYRLTTRDLKDAYAKTGSLAGVERETKAGSGCTGCKVVLQSLFGESASDHYQQNMVTDHGTACVKPGHRVMKGFVIADEQLDSIVYSSNAVAPQLGACNSTTDIEYALLDHTGKAVLHERRSLATNETFVFDTRTVALPRPFYGMFLLSMGRSNLGASRFNVYWTNGTHTTSTHENSDTGRPRVFIPFTLTRQDLEGPNQIYAAIMNPRAEQMALQTTLMNIDSSEELSWHSNLGPYQSCWVNATESFYRPGARSLAPGRLTLRISNEPLDADRAPTVYFFVYHRELGSWTCNHL